MEKRSFRSVPARLALLALAMLGAALLSLCLGAACRAADVPAIAAMGRKGGSNVAAAICNALLYTAVDALDPARRGWQG